MCAYLGPQCDHRVFLRQPQDHQGRRDRGQGHRAEGQVPERGRQAGHGCGQQHQRAGNTLNIYFITWIL